MGPMVRGAKLDRRRLTKLGVVGLVAMFAWSLIAAPSSVGQSEEIVEPETVSSYYTFGDAAPLTSFLDLQVLLLPGFGPALVHSNTEVALPSSASSIAWLLDGGLGNSLHGTTTGAAVPTEASAQQPGGAPRSEFATVGGPIGEEEFGRAAAGVARATATHSDAPRGFANAYLSDVCLFPAAGSPPEPPGGYDPDAMFPGGPNQSPVPDPGPMARQCIVSAASMSSVSESVRDGDTVTSIAVAEISGITIGDRTSDNRCTNCFYIDAMRVEAFAKSNGQPGGSRAGYRLMMGRACRRTFEPSTVNTVEDAVGGLASEPPADVPPREVDQCLPLNGDAEGFPEGDRTLSEIDTDQLNDFFENNPILAFLGDCPGTEAPCTIAIRITAGQKGHTEPRRAQHTSNPPEDPCRNYAYPDPDSKAKPMAECEALGVKTGADRDQGQEAKAVAEGIDIDILTLTGTQFIPPNEDLESCFDAQIPDQLRQVYGTVKAQVGCPIAGLRSVRELNLTFGVAQAAAVARPNVALGPVEGGDGGLGGVIPPITPPIGGPILGGGGGGGGSIVGGGGGLGAGKYALKIDWKSLKIKPWPAKDLAKATLAGAIVLGMIWLIRRRVRQA